MSLSQSAPLSRLDCNESSQSKRDLLATAGAPALTTTCPARKDDFASATCGAPGELFREGGLQSRPETNCSLVSVKSAVKANSLSTEDGVFLFCFFSESYGRAKSTSYPLIRWMPNKLLQKNNAFFFYFYDISRGAAKR